MPDLRGDGFATPLADESFNARWQGQRIGELFTIVKGTMPADAPKSLKDEEYADIIAFLLSKNGYPAGQAELSRNVDDLMQLFFRKS